MKIINTSGKKKTATARATLKDGKGVVRINKVPLDIWEPRLARLKIQEPVQIAGDLIRAMNIDVVVSGGGTLGQTDAVRPLLRHYLNRLSDLLFVLARTINRAQGGQDVLWQNEKAGVRT